MSKQVITLDYLSGFTNGIVSFNDPTPTATNPRSSYCPTYKEITSGTYVKNWDSGYTISGTDPKTWAAGIFISGYSVDSNGSGYTDSQLVDRGDLYIRYTVLTSSTIFAEPILISCCSGTSNLTTKAHYTTHLKSESSFVNELKDYTGTTDSVSIDSSSSASSYASIASNVVTIKKNAIDSSTTNTGESNSKRSFNVIVSTSYSGISATGYTTITQRANRLGGWVHSSQTTNSINAVPSSMTFDLTRDTKTYAVKRNYTQLDVAYDSCGVIAKTSSYTQTEYVTSHTYSTTVGSMDSNFITMDKQAQGAAAKNGTATITYDGKTTTISISQPANSATTSVTTYVTTSLTLNPTSMSFPITGGTISFTTTSNESGCTVTTYADGSTAKTADGLSRSVSVTPNYVIANCASATTSTIKMDAQKKLALKKEGSAIVSYNGEIATISLYQPANGVASVTTSYTLTSITTNPSSMHFLEEGGTKALTTIGHYSGYTTTTYADGSNTTAVTQESSTTVSPSVTATCAASATATSIKMNAATGSAVSCTATVSYGGKSTTFAINQDAKLTV